MLLFFLSRAYAFSEHPNELIRGEPTATGEYIVYGVLIGAFLLVIASGIIWILSGKDRA